MDKKAIFKMMSVLGMILGAVGTLLSNLGDDRVLDMTIDEKIDEKLASYNKEEESEES
ncbi:hypothetical protein AALD01_04425 [Oscillospiraceae bacterium 21-37]